MVKQLNSFHADPAPTNEESDSEYYADATIDNSDADGYEFI